MKSEINCRTAITFRKEGLSFEECQPLTEAVFIACSSVEVSGVTHYAILGREDECPIEVEITKEQEFIVNLDGEEYRYDYVWIEDAERCRRYWPHLEWAKPDWEPTLPETKKSKKKGGE